jgi:DNA-binding CsgD family transcriptional regulator
VEAGKIVERGKHEELLELRGRYHELVGSQREPMRNGVRDDYARRAELDDLTKREHEVLRLVANGLSNDEIADSLAISPVTARTYVSRIRKKLGCRDRAQLVTFAHETAAVAQPTDRTSSLTS